MEPADAGRDQAGRWRKGRSGNQRGKIAGCRNRITLAAEALLIGEGEALARKAIELALAGDTMALRLCLDRVLPPRKGRPVTLTLGPMQTPADLAAALGAVVQAVARGRLTPDEGAAVAAILETQRRAIETAELEQRITALEARHSHDPRS